MNSQELSKQEYKNRIIRVMDYVSANVDQEIDLATMARVALFSPYHFHRIFTFMVGETPNNFVSRIRLEKAARLLHNEQSESISNIAFQCGFGNFSSFSRAFKIHFGVSAKEFRQQSKGILGKDGIRYSKNGKVVSKICKHGQQINDEFCSVELKQLIIMNTTIEIKQLPELNLISYRMTGAFDQVGFAYEKLFKWAFANGVINASTKAVTVYHDDPSVTDMNKMRHDVSIISDADIKPEGEISKIKTEAGKYVVGHFEIHQSEFEKAWNTMYAWLSESGFQPREASPYEVYHNDASQHPEHKFIIDICIPVKPL